MNLWSQSLADTNLAQSLGEVIRSPYEVTIGTVLPYGHFCASVHSDRSRTRELNSLPQGCVCFGTLLGRQLLCSSYPYPGIPILASGRTPNTGVQDRPIQEESPRVCGVCDLHIDRFVGINPILFPFNPWPLYSLSLTEHFSKLCADCKAKWVLYQQAVDQQVFYHRPRCNDIPCETTEEAQQSRRRGRSLGGKRRSRPPVQRKLF